VNKYIRQKETPVRLPDRSADWKALGDAHMALLARDEMQAPAVCAKLRRLE
jgi:hypothetical protein